MIALLDPYYIQKLCLCSFIHKELAKAEIKAQHGIGEKIIEDAETTREKLKHILSYYHKNGLIMKNTKMMSQKSRKVNIYLNKIQNSIDFIIDNNKKAFSYKEDTTLHWIPAYFALTILKRLENFGFKYYPKDINLDELIEAFEKVETVEKNEKLAYWKMARLILQNLNYLEK